MFVILSNVLELFFAYCAVERSEGFRDLGLDVRSASNVVLPCGKLLKITQQAMMTDLSFCALVITLLEKTFRSQSPAL